MSRKNNPQRQKFRSQKFCDVEIEVFAEAEVPLPLGRVTAFAATP